jgi:hypothetical protein
MLLLSRFSLRRYISTFFKIDGTWKKNKFEVIKLKNIQSLWNLLKPTLSDFVNVSFCEDVNTVHLSYDRKHLIKVFDQTGINIVKIGKTFR